VTESTHPYLDKWWRPGHIIGYEHTFTHAIADFVKAVVDEMEGRAPSRPKTSRTPQRASLQPDFEDGLQTQGVLEAISRSARNNRSVKL
jgi:predicted dehydrogenase